MEGPFVDLIESALACAGHANEVVYSKSFKIVRAEYFAAGYMATSSGTVSLKIELEQSYTAPATEQAADTNFVVPEGASAIESALGNETMHYKALSPVTMPYARFKITCLVTNDASTVLKLMLGKSES